MHTILTDLDLHLFNEGNHYRTNICEPVASSGRWATFIPGLDAGEIVQVQVGGEAVLVGEGFLEV